MKAKEFIEVVLINETGAIHIDYPYISFGIMAVGIEFLGKCLNSSEDWHKSNKNDIENAINTLDSLKKYRPYLKSHKLADSLRNGMLHSFVPKPNISLSSKEQAQNLYERNGILNLKCEDFYQDFKNACEEVITMQKFPSRKMDSEILTVPKK
jgi:hypothetical protein